MWISTNKISTGLPFDDEVFPVTNLVPAEIGPLGLLYPILPIITHLLPHGSNRILGVRSLNFIYVVSPVRSQVSPDPLIEWARQLSTRIHIEEIYVMLLFDKLSCFFDSLRAQGSSRLVFLSFGNKKESFFFFLFLVMKSTIHGSPFIITILI